MKQLADIINQFKIEGSFQSVAPIGSGHINDSYHVSTTPGSGSGYVLQRINHRIFRNVPELINNILIVTRHLKQKFLCKHADLDFFQVIQLIPTKKGHFFFHDPEGNYWRLYDHIGGSKSYDVLTNPEMAYEAGKAYGLFQYLASDIDAKSLFEVLPDFHNIASRLATFRDTVARDPSGRVKDVVKEIAFVASRADEMHTILRLGEKGLIPLRVTHNDTKCNNVLFNSGNKAIAVVDLDTVMPGYILYDFGDAIRTGASTGAEDEADLSRVNIDLDLFESYSKGYLEVARNFLNKTEIDYLAFSAKFMTYIIGLRFLTDHIDGDRYYKIAFPGHNLQRAKAQFKLMQSMEQCFSSMEEIIQQIKSSG
jgi:hypothetical protein